MDFFLKTSLDQINILVRYKRDMRLLKWVFYFGLFIKIMEFGFLGVLRSKN